MGTREFNPPYLAFKTLTNLFDRLAETGIPNRIDRTYLGYLAGITQTYLLAALRMFDLLDDDDRPTDKLIALVNERERRSELIGDLVRTYYPEALQLGSGATPGELSELFREDYGVTGETNRKAITFFLNAAQFGNVPLSQHYKMPRAAGTASTNSGGTTQRRKRGTARRRAGGVTPEQSTAPTGQSVESLRTRYIDMLMKKAEAQDEFDADLLNRIETLLGFDLQSDEDEQED
jgi:hypothetical protein